MILWLLLPYLLWRGFCEGMVMTRAHDKMSGNSMLDGVRCHKWFKAYHILTFLRDAIPIAYIIHIFSWFVIGLLVVGWELSELAYNYARYKKFIIPHENVMGMVSVNGVIYVYSIHAIRIIIGVYLCLH